MVVNINFGRKKAQQPSFREDLDGFCTLSYKARIIGFLCCLLAGAVLVGMGYLAIVVPSLVPRIGLFVILYTLGNVVALLGTMFLVGPMNQFRSMFKNGRIIATSVYLTMIFLTLFFAFKKMALLALLCSILQMLALLWYGLSYIPYARTMVKKCLGIPTEL